MKLQTRVSYYSSSDLCFKNMASGFKKAVAKARQSYKKGDDVATVSWLSRAASAVPAANENDDSYDAVYNRLSDFVTKGQK